MVYSKCLISTVVNNFVQQVEKTTYFIFPVMQWDAMFKTGNFELSRSTEILEGWYCESSVARFAINPSRSRQTETIQNPSFKHGILLHHWKDEVRSFFDLLNEIIDHGTNQTFAINHSICNLLLVNLHCHHSGLIYLFSLLILVWFF